MYFNGKWYASSLILITEVTLAQVTYFLCRGFLYLTESNTLNSFICLKSSMVLLLAILVGTLSLFQTCILTIRVEVHRTSTFQNPSLVRLLLLPFHVSSSGMNCPVESNLLILFPFLNVSCESFCFPLIDKSLFSLLFGYQTHH